MKLSVVIPAHNEEGSIAETVIALHAELSEELISHEIIVVNDNSSDSTEEVLQALGAQVPTLVYFNNTGPNGYGYAVREGLRRFRGDCVAVMMADLSDSPKDLVVSIAFAAPGG